MFESAMDIGSSPNFTGLTESICPNWQLRRARDQVIGWKMRSRIGSNPGLLLL
jgi:hypothetical protein